MAYGNKYFPKERTSHDRGMKLVRGAFPLLEFLPLSIENKRGD
jgi:hypothetical protein